MIHFFFTKDAERTFLKLPKEIQKRILEKLKEIKKHDDIFSILKRLNNLEPATHRMRIGMYRLILELKSHERSRVKFWVLDVGHRKDIYR